MRYSVFIMFFLCCALLVPQGCRQNAGGEGGLLQPSANDAGALSLVSPPLNATLGPFTLTYLGRTVNVTLQQSTFKYVLTGPSVQVAFVLEVPPCANEPLVGYAPTNGVNFNQDPVIFPSIRWNPPTTSATTVSDTFSYTIGGIVKEGVMRTGVQTTGGNIYGTIAGPSKLFDVSGTVYSDANTNGTLDAGEAGISGVSVLLLNGSNAVVAATTSGPSGSYLFPDILCGSYTVKADTNTLTSQTQSSYISPTTSVVRSVSIGPDSPGNNFGFTPRTDKLIHDIGSTLPTTGASARAWKKQFQGSIKGGKAAVSRDTLLAYLSRINALALPAPFQFTLDNAGLQSAYDILSNPTRTEIADLLQQLLATELNYERGLGLSDQSLQLVLIGWSESLAAGTLASATAFRPVTIPQAGLLATSLSTATQILTQINSGGGGGLE